MWWPELEKKVQAISSTVQPPSEPHRKDSDLLRENLELTRSLVIEHQKLIQVLTQGGLTDVQAVVRALSVDHARDQMRLGPRYKAEEAGFVAGLAAGLTAKSE